MDCLFRAILSLKICAETSSVYAKLIYYPQLSSSAQAADPGISFSSSCKAFKDYLFYTVSIHYFQMRGFDQTETRTRIFFQLHWRPVICFCPFVPALTTSLFVLKLCDYFCYMHMTTHRGRIQLAMYVYHAMEGFTVMNAYLHKLEGHHSRQSFAGRFSCWSQQGCIRWHKSSFEQC